MTVAIVAQMSVAGIAKIVYDRVWLWDKSDTPRLPSNVQIPQSRKMDNPHWIVHFSIARDILTKDVTTMARRTGNRVFLEANAYYQMLHLYAEIIQSKPISRHSKDQMLLKLDDWITYYHEVIDEQA